MFEDTNYSIGDTTFAITHADIVSLTADALVSSDDSYLTMGGGVSAAIRAAAGSALVADTKKHVPLSLGDVAVTSAGDISAKYVFHGITIDLANYVYADADIIRKVTHRCLELAVALGIQRIAFPALGTGTAGVPAEPCAEAMTREITSFLSTEPNSLKLVTLALLERGRADRDTVAAFYAKSAELAVQWTGSRRLSALVNELDSLLPHDEANRALRGDLRRLIAGISSAKASLGNSALSAHAVDQLQRSAGLQELSKSADDVLVRSQEVIDWEDRRAQEKILRARLESLRTQENATYGNRNRLEEQKSNYAPADVPLHLLNALDGVAAELKRIGGEISHVKSELTALAQGSESGPH